jgi:hypothetical protein
MIIKIRTKNILPGSGSQAVDITSWIVRTKMAGPTFQRS